MSDYKCLKCGADLETMNGDIYVCTKCVKYYTLDELIKQDREPLKITIHAHIILAKFAFEKAFFHLEEADRMMKEESGDIKDSEMVKK